MRISKFLEKRVALRLVFELIVIFLGVYFAFLMENYRQDNEDRERLKKISISLQSEIDVFLNRAGQNIDFLSNVVDTWETQYKAGKKPDPIYLYYRGDDSLPYHMWESTIASGQLSLFEPKDLAPVSRYYQELKTMLRKYRNSFDYSVENILPYLKNSAHFYTDGKNVLKPQYLHYMKRFKDIVKLAARLKTLAADAKNTLVQIGK